MRDTLVVVEDEPEILDVVCMFLEDEGYDVLSLSRPELAAALSPEVHPVLFLMDLMLPRMSGIELARRLRQDGYPETPMIAMSASSWFLSQARASGLFEATVSKPFELLDLLRVVQHSVH